MIYIASDHGGYELKQKILKHLVEQGREIKDLGPDRYNGEDDYPDFAIPLAEKVQENPNNRGIVICRNGVGVSMTVNKYKDIRATLSWNPAHAKSSRLDDNTNVLALPADYVEDETAVNIVDTWLNTEFSGLPKHIRRIKKVDNIK